MPTVHMVFGPLGAGKTTLARQLSITLNGICFSVDEWMQRLYGPDVPNPISLAWVLPRVQRCETQIWRVCLQVLASGRDVILDQGFLTLAERDRVRLLARDAGYSVSAHFVDADRLVRQRRVMQRNVEKGGTYVFDVTDAMFDVMDARFERPTGLELEGCVNV